MSDPGDRRSGLNADPNLLGLLSLQLLLLAFFIMLVGMSSFDTERVRSVLSSVQAVFADVGDAKDGADEISRADAIALDAIVDQVEGVLATALELDRVERIGRGAATFELPASALFAAGSAHLVPGREGVLRRLVAALERRPAGYRAELELLVGRGGSSGAAEAAAPLPLEIARAGTLARAAVAAGATPADIAAGLLPQRAGRVRIVLRLTDRPRPHNLFAGGPPVAAEAQR